MQHVKHALLHCSVDEIECFRVQQSQKEAEQSECRPHSSEQAPDSGRGEVQTALQTVSARHAELQQ